MDFEEIKDTDLLHQCHTQLLSATLAILVTNMYEQNMLHPAFAFKVHYTVDS